jgi:hypothetical protein
MENNIEMQNARKTSCFPLQQRRLCCNTSRTIHSIVRGRYLPVKNDREHEGHSFYAVVTHWQFPKTNHVNGSQLNMKMANGIFSQIVETYYFQRLRKGNPHAMSPKYIYPRLPWDSQPGHNPTESICAMGSPGCGAILAETWELSIIHSIKLWHWSINTVFITNAFQSCLHVGFARDAVSLSNSGGGKVHCYFLVIALGAIS